MQKPISKASSVHGHCLGTGAGIQHVNNPLYSYILIQKLRKRRFGHVTRMEGERLPLSVTLSCRRRNKSRSTTKNMDDMTLQSKIKAYSKQWNLQETELCDVHSWRHHHRHKIMDDKERRRYSPTFVDSDIIDTQLTWTIWHADQMISKLTVSFNQVVQIFTNNTKWTNLF